MVENAEMGLKGANGREARGLGICRSEVCHNTTLYSCFYPDVDDGYQACIGLRCLCLVAYSMENDDDAPVVELAGKFSAVGVGLYARSDGNIRLGRGEYLNYQDLLRSTHLHEAVLSIYR
jgi:hypothetical protein